MGKAIEETLGGYGWNVIDEEIPDVDDRGNVVRDALGQPKTKKVTTLVFYSQTPPGWPGEQHVVKVPMSDEMRVELAAKLTGGIQVTSTIPKGVMH